MSHSNQFYRDNLYKRRFYKELLKEPELYIARHPKTCDMDLKIAKALEQGSTIQQITMDIPCSQTTAYRAIRRLRDFLCVNPKSVEVLKEHVTENPPDFGDGDAKSILDMLYCKYEDHNRFETPEIKKGFKEIYSQLDHLPLQEMDRYIDTTCHLCREHEMSGFTEGVKVGIRLAMELEN